MAITRLYRPRDRDALRDLVLKLHKSVRPFDDVLLPWSEIGVRYFEALLAQVEDTEGVIYVAEADDRIVGHVILFGLVGPCDPDERPERYTSMAELFVEPAHRGHGIGRALVERAESYARRLGAYKLELKVLAENESAIGFYENLGYASRVLVMSKRI